MVGWYNPVQLAKTGRDVLISTIVGRHSDRRLVEALTAEDAFLFDYRHQPYEPIRIIERKSRGGGLGRELREEIWIDYVADTGDGWDSTYGVAYWLVQPHVQVRDETGRAHELPRGEVLVFGGDQVYPTASREAYEARFVTPYRDALDRMPAPVPQTYAIPGNHDWYDGLSAFTELFCDEQTTHFAGGRWETPQNRSYFGLRLPGNWWLIGIDLQLSSDVDAVQIQYFRKLAENMKDGDRVILCSPEPYWVFQLAYGENDARKDARLKRGYLETHVFGAKKVQVYLAGDLHHYFHLEEDDGVHKITAGGGGAFLHPTHGELGKPLDRKRREAGRKPPTRYPDNRDSRRRALLNLFFLPLNPLFGAVTSIMYFLTAWAVMSGIPRSGETVNNYSEAWTHTVRALVETPIALPGVVLILGGFFLFTDTHSPLYRFAGGLVHGLTHLAAVFFIGWESYFGWRGVVHQPWPLRSDTPLWSLGKWSLLVLLGGYVIGSLVMGMYLLISINVFGRHSNEAFSSLRVRDWKNFLRMRITKDGTLTIYSIGIRRVPRKWRPRASGDAGVSKYQPAGNYSEPQLIEKPIFISTR
jgi:Calcineurin-like phosphoesterase